MTNASTTAQAMTMSGVIPHLSLSDASRAMEFYKRAFGASEVVRMPADDGKRLLHGHVKINGGDVMMADFFPEHGYAQVPAQAFSLHLHVTDVDAWWKRALDAGCEVVMPLEKQFWGDRYGQMKDPFGVTWSMGAPDKG